VYPNKKPLKNRIMTLEELIKEYKMEDYAFWKYKDKEGNDIKAYFVFDTHSDYLDKYLNFYKNLPNLTELIVHAADGVFKLTKNGVEYFIRHNHQEVFLDRLGNQRGVPFEISRQVRDNLIKRMNDIFTARTFDEIFKIVTDCKVKGFGELSIYDTSMRIASYLNIEPDKVYLHAGARKGMEILEKKGYVYQGSAKRKFIEINAMPEPLKQLTAAETEHFLCSKKEKMKNLEKVK
jgi:hypothetical protein